MQFRTEDVVKVSQDNYGRWFVKAEAAGRKRPPIRCLSEQEARDMADRLRKAEPLRKAA